MRLAEETAEGASNKLYKKTRLELESIHSCRKYNFFLITGIYFFSVAVMKHCHEYRPSESKACTCNGHIKKETRLVTI
jgi:hypothetical protein